MKQELLALVRQTTHFTITYEHVMTNMHTRLVVQVEGFALACANDRDAVTLTADMYLLIRGQGSQEQFAKDLSAWWAGKTEDKSL